MFRRELEMRKTEQKIGDYTYSSDSQNISQKTDGEIFHVDVNREGTLTLRVFRK